jgi:tryptophan 2,3-dioxygenase
VATTVFDVLIKKIEDQKSSAIEVLQSGTATDFAQYRDLCGLIRGLEIAQREIRDLAQNYLDDDND